MTEEKAWDGRGLPPSAQSRLEAATRSSIRGSLLSVPDATALADVGFTSIGEAMGCCVQQQAEPMIAYGSGGTDPSRTISSGSGDRWAGVGQYARTMYRGWDTAIARMVAEAKVLGADGVVGVRLVERALDTANHEYLALGTPVRAERSPVRAVQPFTTDLNGCDVAKLLHASWVPTQLVLGLAVAVRGSDRATYRQTRRWSRVNEEVAAFTDLVTVARHDARDQFGARARASGARGAIMSHSELRLLGPDVERRILAPPILVLLRGTGITDFARRGSKSPPAALRIMALTTTEKRPR